MNKYRVHLMSYGPDNKQCIVNVETEGMSIDPSGSFVIFGDFTGTGDRIKNSYLFNAQEVQYVEELKEGE